MRKLLLLLFTIHHLLLTTCNAAFEDIGIGARGRGMGEAFTAVVDDATAIYWNPSALSLIRKKEFFCFYQDLYSLGLLNYSFLGYVHPRIGGGSIGFGWIRLGTTNEVKFMKYSENTFIFSYGVEIYKNTYAGGNIKYYFVDYEYRASGISSDISALYSINKNLRLGILWQNFFHPELYWQTGAIDTLPSIFRCGIKFSPLENHCFSVEVLSKKGKYSPSGGWEGWFFGNVIGLRMGLIKIDDNPNFSMGISIGIKNLRIDYSLENHYSLGLSSTYSLKLRI